MANINITIGSGAYSQLLANIDGWKAKLEPLRVPLGKILRNPAQRQKAIDFAKTDDGRLLKQTHLFKKWLDQWYEDIGWEEGDD